MSNRLRDFYQFWVALCVFTGLFLFIFGYTAHSFEASITSQSEIGNGTYLVQSEGEAPEICHSVASTIKRLIEVDPGVEIFQHSNDQGEKEIVAYFSDSMGVILPVQSGEIICNSRLLSPFMAMIYREMTNDPESKLEVVPVWPQQEE